MVATCARADVTITSTMTSRASGVDVTGTSVTFVKGRKLRTDTTIAGRATTTIIDLDARTLVTVDHGARRATRYDMDAEAAKLSGPVTSMKLTRTGERRTLLDQPCDGFSVEVTAVSFTAFSGHKTRTTMRGTAWIAAASPGRTEYAAFHAAVDAKGLFLAGVQTVRGDPAMAKALGPLYGAMAREGVPYALETTTSVESLGPPDDHVLTGQPVPPGAPRLPAGQRGPSGSSSIAVSAVSTDPIPDATFEVPAGFTVRLGSERK